MLTMKCCTLFFCLQCTQTYLVLLPIPKRDTAHVYTLLRVMAAHTEVITEHYAVDLLSTVYLFVFVCAFICQRCK